jgi:hypothetical protein
MKYILPLLILITSCYPNRKFINSIDYWRIDSISTPIDSTVEVYLSTEKYLWHIPVEYNKAYKVGNYVTPRYGKRLYLRFAFEK